VIDIFKGKTNGFATGLFLFDNTPSHQKRAPDALSARKMPKNPHPTWTHHKEGPKMRTTRFGEDQKIQDLYFDHDHPTMPGWFKGMEVIIRERGLWPEKGMNAQCDGFKCVAGKTDCCCRRLLFTQPDFVAQKSHLEELITSRSHICDFYPKYHCELNFIEQYWGAAKLCYRNSPKTMDINEMEANMKACLDNVPLVQIKRCVTLSFYFTSLIFHLSRGMQIDQLALSMHMHRVPPDRLPFGRTESIMDTAHSPLKSSANSRTSSTKSTDRTKYYLSYPSLLPPALKIFRDFKLNILPLLALT
jgi:hypothetical protein